MEKISQTAVSGYFYNRVMEDRLAALKQASVNRSSSLVLEPYDVALKHLLEARFPSGVRRQYVSGLFNRPHYCSLMMT